MREVKFRAWNDIDKKMIDWYVLKDSPFFLVELIKGREKYYKLDQYTGLNDKNGVEIYEGDIVDGVILSDYSIHIGRVLFDFNGYRIVTKEKSLPLGLPEKLTVIGNIHRQPHLLEPYA